MSMSYNKVRYHQVRYHQDEEGGFWVEIDGRPVRGIKAFDLSYICPSLSECTITFLTDSVNEDSEPTKGQA
jgi:hypothetical protein